MPDDPISVFVATMAGRLPVPAGAWYGLVETRWSYRRPISYEVRDTAQRPVATVVPADTSTRTRSLVIAGGEVRLVIDIDRAGDTTVSDSGDRQLGRLLNRSGIWRCRLVIHENGTEIGSLRQPWRRAPLADIQVADHAKAAQVHRSSRGRFAGARLSWFDLTPHAGRVPAPLLFAAVPALDAARRKERRRLR
jgi:hypothetical protein